jgi:Asp-tRNA(Asn)/Glu-tRNA(Gln) amidotransferase A subunit family amidase
VKENFDVAGYDSTFGVGKRLGFPATRDALLVHVARSLGAVPFCKTNVPQTMLSFCCGNPIYGLTGNPHDVDRTCGGSSGGEGALLAAGGSCLGLGTDIGGSVRIPAHFSGCVGFKPTIARISRKGAQGATPGAVGGENHRLHI